MDGRVDVDGVGIAYGRWGAGRPLVLLHGWACNRRFWREQVPILARTHLVLAPDLRGHGESDVPTEGHTLERLAADVRDVMGELGMPRAVVVGHSMGGMVAQRLVTNHPEAVSGLVLIATACADPEDTLVSKRIADEAPGKGYEAALLSHFPEWFVPDSDPALMEWVRSQMLRTPQRVALALVEAYRDLDLRTDMRHVRVPALVVGAAGDSSAPSPRSQELARIIAGARLEVIERAGHFVQLERPLEVNHAMGGFLADHGL